MRITEADLKQFLCSTYNVPYNTQYVRLHEPTQYVKHACNYIGVQALPLTVVQQLSDGRTVSAQVCCYCKTIWYYVSEVI